MMLVCDFRGVVDATRWGAVCLTAACVACSVAVVSSAQTQPPVENLTLAIGPIVPPLFYLDEQGGACDAQTEVATVTVTGVSSQSISWAYP